MLNGIDQPNLRHAIKARISSKEAFGCLSDWARGHIADTALDVLREMQADAADEALSAAASAYGYTDENSEEFALFVEGAMDWRNNKPEEDAVARFKDAPYPEWAAYRDGRWWERTGAIMGQGGKDGA